MGKGEGEGKGKEARGRTGKRMEKNEGTEGRGMERKEIKRKTAPTHAALHYEWNFKKIFS